MEMSLDIRLETEWIMEIKYRNIKPVPFSMQTKSKGTDFRSYRTNVQQVDRGKEERLWRIRGVNEVATGQQVT
jgi:hypothetical protein